MRTDGHDIRKSERQAKSPRRLRPSRQSSIGSFSAPWFVHDPTDRDATGAIGLNDGADRDESEGVRGAIANLTIDVLAAYRRRQHNGRNELAPL